ncbi:MAG: response regulator [Chloroflexi bacterium]|nr:response regulator [Chloroflexota bacterium]
MAIKPAARKLRLLIADDNPDTIRLLTLLLQTAGHTVISAASGREALARLASETADMILLDVMMPDMDGFGVLEEVRKTSSAPILMLTALSNRAAVERGFQLGADDYVVKPFSPDQLFARLERLTSLLPPPEKSAAAPADSAG